MNKINIAVKLTLLRILLVPFFMVFMFIDNLWTRIFAFIIFIIAGLTDLFDGILARRFNVTSNFGIFLDPLADKLIISAAFISFVGLKELGIPAWMVVIIISRDFIITGLRLLAISHGRIIPADKAGKFKTTSQIVSINIILLILIMNSFVKRFFQPEKINQILGMLKTLPFWIMLYVTILTVYSGVLYLYTHRDIISLEIKE
ncbi:MAG: CDP-diacylglycerol--glycerol-3-phosphate 3-phosphatidyltransferase [Endomicrobiia bacterium]